EPGPRPPDGRVMHDFDHRKAGLAPPGRQEPARVRSVVSPTQSTFYYKAHGVNRDHLVVSGFRHRRVRVDLRPYASAPPALRRPGTGGARENFSLRERFRWTWSPDCLG